MMIIKQYDYPDNKMFSFINTSVYYRETQVANKNHGDTVYRSTWQNWIKQWQYKVDLKVLDLHQWLTIY